MSILNSKTLHNKREWYVSHLFVIYPKKPDKVPRAFNGAAKFHGIPLNQPRLVGSDLLQNPIFVLLPFRQQKYAVYADKESKFLQVGFLDQDRPSFRFFFVAGGSHIGCVVRQDTRHIFVAGD